jgi:glycine cleavage system protein P-like pyridoxal-binding family
MKEEKLFLLKMVDHLEELHRENISLEKVEFHQKVCTMIREMVENEKIVSMLTIESIHSYCMEKTEEEGELEQNFREMFDFLR